MLRKRGRKGKGGGGGNAYVRASVFVWQLGGVYGYVRSRVRACMCARGLLPKVRGQLRAAVETRIAEGKPVDVKIMESGV